MSHDRFVSNAIVELQEANRGPIFGYQHLSIPTIDKAIEKLILLVPGIEDYVSKAKEDCNRHSNILTLDESAALYLYSMPISFFSCLNDTLRAEKRHALKPWFAFLKLFLTALEKLPSTKETIWRGVCGDVGSIFVDNDIHIWWSINSCSMALNIVQPFLGEKGTLFAIDAMHGKDISAFSAIPDEQEVILMPGTCVRARCQSLSFIDRLFVVHLKEENPQSEPQTEPSCLFELIKHEYQRNSRIERIMNPSKSFPIEQSYINLAIVEIKEQQEKEKKLLHATLTNEIIGTYEEIYGTKTRIEIENIFERCTEQTKNILVLGRAGIGKTTFCRYVAYQWATGAFWQQYQLVIFIRLRNLTEGRYPPLTSGTRYSLVDLIKTEYCCYNLSEKDEKLLKEQLDKSEVLWLLDGYDEITQNVPSYLEYLFEQLLKTPHHIITSRPYLNTLSYNVQLEITGFTDDNIEEYVEQFFDQIKDEIDNGSFQVQKLLSFLKYNSRVWGIAHIPVNLELLCSLWCDSDSSDAITMTMTAVYDKMTEWLCRRYLKKQNISSSQMTKEDVFAHCHKELAFLESLAFYGMKSNTILLRPQLLRRASKESGCSLQHQPHLLNIGILKSLDYKPIGTHIEADKSHYFLHLSFQEYFAARYLISALNNNEEQKKKAIDFIQVDKYNPRFELVLTFTAGLLINNDNEQSMNCFWNTLLGEPLDLIGLRHVQIIIPCLDEAGCNRHIPRFRESMNLIIKWIKYSVSKEQDHLYTHIETSLRRCSSLVNQTEILDTIITLHQDEDLYIKNNAYYLITDLPISNPCLDLIYLHLQALNNEDASIRRIAYNALGNMGEKAATKEVLSRLINALEDPDDYVRWIVCEAIAKLGEKAATDEMISKLMNALEDTNQYIRCNACEAFGKLGEKVATTEVINRLVNTLGDRIHNVRLVTCETLQKINEKAPNNEVVNRLVTALGDTNPHIRHNACDALGKLGEKAATNEVIDRLVFALGATNPHIRRNACEVLGKLSEKAAISEVVSRLMSALEDTNDYVRQHACEVLGKLGEKVAFSEVISKLVSALEDTNSDVRRKACNALGKLGEKAATDGVINQILCIVKDAKSDVRRSAYEALGKLGEKEASNAVINVLINALGDTDDYARRSAFEALGKLSVTAATDEVIDRLIAAFGDTDNHVRRIACEAIGRMGEKAATNEMVEKLLSGFRDSDDYVRRNVCEALGKLGEIARTNEVINTLIEALFDRHLEVRRSACEALQKMNEKAVTYEVIRSLVSAHGNFKRGDRCSVCKALKNIVAKGISIEVVNKILSALKNSNSNVKRGACEVVEKLGEQAATKEIVNGLVSALKNSDLDVRCSAWNALGQIGEKAAIDTVIDIFISVCGDADGNVRWRAYEAIGRMGEKAATVEVINGLMKALEDKKHCIRRSACESLGKLGKKAATEEVINALVNALGDKNFDVRRNASEVLCKIGDKVATNEVVRRLLKICNDTNPEVQHIAIETSEKILSSLLSMTHFDSFTVKELSLFINRFSRTFLYKLSPKKCVEAFLNTKIQFWLPIITNVLLYQSNAVTVSNGIIMLYGSNELVQLSCADRELVEQLKYALTNRVIVDLEKT